MMATCPKCGYQLKITQLKPDCPNCGTNLMYYQMDQRLEADHSLAEKEVAAVKRIIQGIKSASVGSVLPIIRLVAYLLSIAALLLPVFQTKRTSSQFLSTSSLLDLIIAMTEKGADMMAVLFGSQTAVLVTVFFFGSVLFLLISLILSLFSFTKHGTGRNMIMAAFTALIQIVPAALLASGGSAVPDIGFYSIAVLLAAVFVLNYFIGKRLKKQWSCPLPEELIQ